VRPEYSFGSATDRTLASSILFDSDREFPSYNPSYYKSRMTHSALRCASPRQKSHTRCFYWIAPFFQVILIHAAWGSSLVRQRPASLVPIGSRILTSGGESRALPVTTALGDRSRSSEI